VIQRPILRYSFTASCSQISEVLSSGKTGLIPTLLSTLSAHSALAQKTLDSEVTHDALDHLLRCRTEFNMLESLVKDGKLPDAVECCGRLEDMLNTAPPALVRAKALAQLKVCVLQTRL